MLPYLLSCHSILVWTFIILVHSLVCLLYLPLFGVHFVVSLFLFAVLSLVSCCLGCLLSCLFCLCRLSFQLFVVVIAFPLSLVSYYLGCMVSQRFMSQFCCPSCLFHYCLFHQWFVLFVCFCRLYCPSYYPPIVPSVISLNRLLCHLSVMLSVICLIRLQSCLFIVLSVN